MDIAEHWLVAVRRADWRRVDLCGAETIERVSSVYEIVSQRIPGGRFKVKVLEGATGFLAIPNVVPLMPDGTPDYVSGMGSSDPFALADLLAKFMPKVMSAEVDDDAFDWAPADEF